MRHAERQQKVRGLMGVCFHMKVSGLIWGIPRRVHATDRPRVCLMRGNSFQHHVHGNLAHLGMLVSCLLLIVAAAIVNGASVRGNTPGVPAMRAPPKKLLDVIFGKHNDNVMVDKMKYDPPPSKQTEKDKKADEFLFSTVEKYKAEEVTKDKIKKKIQSQIDAKTVKGPITKFYKAVKAQRFKATHPFYKFDKAVELQKRKEDNAKVKLRIKE